MLIICQDNHLPILLSKHILPCLNAIKVLAEYMAFNHSALGSLEGDRERHQNPLNGFVLLHCKSLAREKAAYPFQVEAKNYCW